MPGCGKGFDCPAYGIMLVATEEGYCETHVWGMLKDGLPVYFHCLFFPDAG